MDKTNLAAARLRKICKRRGVGSKGRLAEELVIPNSSMSELITGRRTATLEEAVKINDVLGIPFRWWLRVDA